MACSVFDLWLTKIKVSPEVRLSAASIYVCESALFTMVSMDKLYIYLKCYGLHTSISLLLKVGFYLYHWDPNGKGLLIHSLNMVGFNPYLRYVGFYLYHWDSNPMVKVESCLKYGLIHI